MTDTKQPGFSLGDYLSCLRKGDDSMRRHLFVEAAQLFRDAIAMRPEMYEGHFKLGNAYMLAEDYLSAIQAYTEAYKRQPKEIDLLVRLSELCYRMKDYSKAAQFLAEVLMLNDRYLPALLVLPELLIRLGRIDDAVDLLKAALPQQPQIPELWMAAGIAMQARGDKDKARIFYREALNLDPKSELAANNLALLDNVA
jgi:tetratricopeptide (TPR) repeat protein